MIKELKIQIKDMYIKDNCIPWILTCENVENIKSVIDNKIKIFYPGKRYITCSIKKHGDTATAKVKVLEGK